MIFGMAISTVTTLVFTPVFYSVLDDLSMKFLKKKAPAPLPQAE